MFLMLLRIYRAPLLTRTFALSSICARVLVFYLVINSACWLTNDSDTIEILMKIDIESC